MTDFGSEVRWESAERQGEEMAAWREKHSQMVDDIGKLSSWCAREGIDPGSWLALAGALCQTMGRQDLVAWCVRCDAMEELTRLGKERTW